ncbi:AbrB/MazE/SpoVT family DNA-binding domain-containing protein [Sphingorhabdus sp.]|uniref:AbrB/MazE/SpoVT family DNA-binding domain-containing protein n=1 Tax=Sphingorhabdus sp. TaxID=1902408 RepID=UPI0032B7774D
MSKLSEERQAFRTDGAASVGVPEMATRKQYRTKVFKSGNSLAVRIPAGTDLKPGMEMDLTVEDGVMLALKPIDAPKRKIDVSGFWGKAPGARLIPHGDFDERPSAIAARKALESK